MENETLVITVTYGTDGGETDIADWTGSNQWTVCRENSDGDQLKQPVARALLRGLEAWLDNNPDADFNYGDSIEMVRGK